MNDLIKKYNTAPSLKSKSDIVQDLHNTFGDYEIDDLINDLFKILNLEVNVSIRHEVIFLIGKLTRRCVKKENYVIDAFVSILQSQDSVLIIHEIIEALGMISCMRSQELVSRYLNHANKDIRDTAELAIEELKG
jgi:hypothetical protein